MQQITTENDPIARRAINTAKTAYREGRDVTEAVQLALDEVGQQSMYWAEEDAVGVRIGDFHGEVDIVVPVRWVGESGEYVVTGEPMACKSLAKTA